MKTIEVTLVCDYCSNSRVTGEPNERLGSATDSAIRQAIAKEWAHDGETWTCADCMGEIKRNLQVATWEQSVKDNPPKRVI